MKKLLLIFLCLPMIGFGQCAVSTSLIHISCYGICTGTATVIPSGTTPYAYLWNDALAQTTQSATGLCAGTYTCTVTDASGCLVSTSITLTEPAEILPIFTPTDVSCNGLDDGSIALSTPISGITATNFQYFLNSTNYGNILNINILPPNTYTVEVLNTMTGCSSGIESITITEPAPIAVTSSTTNVSCNGYSDGVIVATATGGATPNYQYSLSGGVSQTNGTFSNLTADTYFIDVTDINGCSSNQTVIITEPNPLFVNAFSTDISCFGYCDGSAFSMPSGGTPPYSYLWSNGNITDITSGLCAGAYVVNITDANNCVNIETVLISEPLPLVSNNTINGCDSVLIGINYYTISGTYTDTLTSVNGCDSIINTNLTIEQNTSSYDTLSVAASIVWNGIPLNVSGDYSVTLINSLGCDSIVNLNLTVATTGISDIANNKSNLVKITDVLGKETPYKRNTPLFYIYDDGTVEKRIVIE